MDLGLIGRAAGMFAVTNVDDILILALFFGQAGRDRAAELRVVVGQYIGFAVILVAAVVGALGAGLLPEKWLPYLGLLPLALGLRAAWQVWRDRGEPEDDDAPSAVGIGAVAAVTAANGGDNVGVYVPVFAASGTASLVVYVVVFLVLVAVWCGLGRFLATRPPVARALTRWGHLLLPVVLVGIGLLILFHA